MIVTHNPDGEYSHLHHILTSKIVTSVTTNNLYYFGRYYSKKKLPQHVDELVKIDDELLKEKQEIMKLYYSQTETIKGFSHFHMYENWESYNEWMSKTNEEA